MIRVLDILFSILGLIILAPFFLIIALWIRLDSKGPAFFKQSRVGKNSKDFRLIKFRSMYLDTDKKSLLTMNERDTRITKAGRILRRYKIDELPQLVNVLKGDMSIVGPRPEVRQFVNLYTPEQNIVLSVRPGITDYASIHFKDEDKMLSAQAEPLKYYTDVILPRKIELNRIFIDHPTIGNYFKVILKTVSAIIS